MGSSQQIVTRLRALWGKLDRPRQLALIGVAGGAVVFLVIFMNMGTPQTYVTAFTNLDPKDSNAVVEQLKADKIPYQLSTDGATIKVPPDKLADARLKLAAKGLPAGGAVGFELFDKTSFGVTDFVQHLNYQRALEGELSRTINSLAQVEGSRVHIVVPKQELFVSQQKPATASVLLRLRAGRSLNENELKGIAHLVARSVEGLEEKNITVLDASGKMLFDGGSAADSGIGLTATQLDVQKKVEKDIETELQTLLDQVAGPNRSAVRVRADLDFSSQEELAETFTPGGNNNQGVPRSSSSVTETFSGASNPAGGQPGVPNNVPGAQVAAAAGANGNSQYQRTETTTNYEVSKSTKKTTTGPGKVKRLSVSVLLDSSISEQDAAGLRNAVAAAAGVDQARGDQVVVTTAAFGGNQQAETVPAAKPGLFGDIGKYLSIGAPLLAAMLVLFVLWRMSRSVAPKRPLALVMGASPALAAAGLTPALAGASGGATALPGAEEGSALESGGGKYTALPEPGRSWETPEQVRHREEVRQRMTNLATANPEAVAEIIHSWMAQDERKR